MVDFQSRDRTSQDEDEDEDETPDPEHDAESDSPDEPADSDHDHEDASDEVHTHDHHDLPDERVGVAVVTVSSTRNRDDDPSGDAIVELLEGADYEIVTRDVLIDDFDGVQSGVDALVGRGDVDALITTGGTGVTPDDVTVDAVEPLFDKTLPGFGELFRHLSYEEVGTKTLASRATAGIVDGVPVFCLPGSENAVRLGTREIVCEELSHLVGLATRE
jgi:molybdenum cofactor biosynthesis protein B